MTWYALSTVVAGVFVSAIAVFTRLKGRKDTPTYLFFWFCVAIALWCLSDFGVNISSNPEMALFMTRILHVGAISTPALFIHFILSLTGSKSRWNVLPYVYAISAICLLLNFTPLFIHSVRPDSVRGYSSLPGPAYNLFLALFGWGAIYGFYKFIPAYRASRGITRIQLKYIFASLFIVVAGGISYFLLNVGIQKELPPIDNILVIMFTSIIAYAVIRHRLMDIHMAITRATVFMTVYTVLLGLPLFAAWTWQTKLRATLGSRWWLGLWLITVALSSAAHYANQYFQRRTEARLLAEQRRYQSVLRQAAQGMTLIKDLRKLLNLVVHLLTQKVRIKHAGVYLWDAQIKKFVPSVSRQWPVKQPESFSRDHPFIEYLHWHRTPIVTEELALQARGGARELQPVVVALKALDAAVVVPSFTENRCEGFLLLGDKISDALFSSDDLQVFQVLASQAALAIENAQFYEELKRTQTDLFQTAKMASLGHMAGGMSHQINNRFHVLTILAGTLKSVLKDTDPDTMERGQRRDLWSKTVETLAKLEENALRGGEIVKTLLKFSRPAGDYKAVTLGQVIATAKEVAQFRVNMGLIDFTEEIPESLPPVKGDLNQLADSCFNLLTNAYDAVQKKATMISEGHLSPSPNDPTPFRGKIWIRAYPEKTDGKLLNVLEVQDNGTGMTPQELDNLFIPFFTTKATAHKGTGLGLYVIQRIVERHGGSITAASKLGAGTTFIIRLPAAVETPQGEPTHA